MRSLAPTVGDFQPYIDDFYGLLDKPKIKNLFSRRGYETTYMGLAMVDDDQVAIEPNRVEVRTERRFAVATEAGFLQGVIDRMVLIYRGDQLIGADIIDLKTEQFNSSKLHDHINRHRPQLQAYRTAAATFLRLPVERISTRLVFIESGQIVNLHVIEGSIDFSPKKRTAAKKAVAKKPSVRMKPESNKPVGANAQPAADKETGDQNPTVGASESTPVKDSAEPVADVVMKKSENKKVDKPASANPPPAKSQSKPSSMRQKTLWD